MSRMKNIFVTGGSGFLGVHVINQLLSHDFRVCSSDMPGKRVKLPLIINHPEFEQIDFDILGDDLGKHFPDGMDCVIHLAGLTNVADSIKHPLKYEQVNVGGTINLLDACREKKIKRFIFASTAAVYGKQSEDAIDETHPVAPLNPYGASKLSAETHILDQCDKYEIDAIILRLFNLYGPNQPTYQSGIIPTFISAALANGNIIILGSGDRTRSFLHVKDAAMAFVKSCMVSAVGRKIVNICGSKSTSLTELSRMIIELTGSSSKVIYTDSKRIAPRSHCTGDLAKRILDFSPRIDIRDGLNETIRSIRQR
ncbi:MAG: NAD-dependent epimerase/dehydratase family protein [Promethearchaeota archaeon]